MHLNLRLAILNSAIGGYGITIVKSSRTLFFFLDLCSPEAKQPLHKSEAFCVFVLGPRGSKPTLFMRPARPAHCIQLVRLMIGMNDGVAASQPSAPGNYLEWRHLAARFAYWLVWGGPSMSQNVPNSQEEKIQGHSR